MKPPRALLFDFDGVMADTENIHVAAWQRTFADLGWEVPDEVCARAAEQDDREFLAAIFAEKKIEGGDVEARAGCESSRLQRTGSFGKEGARGETGNHGDPGYRPAVR